MIEIPIYKNSFNYALEHNEQALYKASNEASLACKEAVENAVYKHYDEDLRLDTKAAIEEVIKQFGIDRLQYVLALTVKDKESDLRISEDNKQWAWGILAFENEDILEQGNKKQYVVGRCHPGLLNLFITTARQEVFSTQA